MRMERCGHFTRISEIRVPTSNLRACANGLVAKKKSEEKILAPPVLAALRT